jgi:predicted Fe-S protein YdhL (DUF1289 family)
MSDQPEQVWRRQEIESPCVRVCVIHPAADICVACFRTRKEIATWSRMAPEDRSRLMQELPGRIHQIAKRRGGRAGRVAKD